MTTRDNLRAAVLSTAFALVGLAVVGCDDGGDDDSAPPPSSPPAFQADALVANVGANTELGQQGFAQTVPLEGDLSFFRVSETSVRQPASAQWTLDAAPAGASVTGLPSSATNTSVTIGANPPLGTYRFKLTVSEGSLSASETVDVTVKKFIITGISDLIQLGFSTASTTITASLAASVTGNASAPTFSWTGFPPEPYLKNVQGASTDTVTFETPRLAEVENLPPQAAILGVWANAAAYQRIKVTATDGAVSVSRTVTVSVGAVTSGNRDVPRNRPVYLCGLPSGPYSWQCTSFPSGASSPTLFDESNASLGTSVNASPAARVVWFNPTVVGLYLFVVVSGQTADTFEVNVAEYLSDGLRATVAPNPDLGQCGGCHGGSIPFLEDKVTPYLGTKHARAIEAVLASATAQGAPDSQSYFTSAPELAYVSTGFHFGRAASPSYTGANAGFDDVAASQGALAKPLDYETFARRYPESARLSSVQCEVCHGPGSLHFGDSEAIGVNIKTDACAQCHDKEPRQWSFSKHAGVVSSPSTNPSCTRCHTAEAALSDAAIEFTHSSNPNAPNPTPSVPVPDESVRPYTATCAVCHDPHAADHSFQLRLAGEYTLIAGPTIDAGNAKNCFQCHNARRAADASSTLSGRSGPHNSSQTELITGTNVYRFAGYPYVMSAHGDPARFVYSSGPKAGQGGQWCLACHMGPVSSGATLDQMGGHSWEVRSKDGQAINSQVCTQCHTVGSSLTSPRGPEFDVQAAGDYDGNGTIQSVQLEISGLLKLLGGAVTPTASAPFGNNSNASDPNPAAAGAPAIAAFARVLNSSAIGTKGGSSMSVLLSNGSTTSFPASPDGDLLAKASWNYFLVMADKSFGIHNPRFTASVLQATLRELNKRLGRPEPAFVPSGVVQ